ncbi:hypothetical protein [Paenibacillus maysiensis]|uniref:hypothetical protein n=1 Tax=Paenibacillus maysiensis TaxID=1155954 RepID=UPI000471AE16|nr:hypothetical protein [Paenibacillus maysiensis]
MAGQGEVTRTIAEKLTLNGWTVLFVCIPNTAHVNVFPIRSLAGGSRQRYPDILAYKGEVTRLIEVEMKLNEYVYDDIQERFFDFVGALKNFEYWQTWKLHIESQVNNVLPINFFPQCELIICGKINKTNKWLSEKLEKEHSIKVSEFKNFIA